MCCIILKQYTFVIIGEIKKFLTTVLREGNRRPVTGDNFKTTMTLKC